MTRPIEGLANKTPAGTFIVELSNGTQITLPVPKIQLKYEEEDLQLDAWRDEAGYLHKIEARRSLRKVELEWPYLNDAQLSLVKGALKAEEYFKFYFYDYDNQKNGVLNEAYSGPLTYSLYSLRYGVGEWIDIHCSVIER